MNKYFNYLCEEYKVYKINGYPVIHLENGEFKYIHRIVAEEKIGRPLKKGEVVHHIDGSRDNYNKSNLMIFDNHKSHASYHMGNTIFEIEKGVYSAITGFYCPICGKELKYKSNMCLDCYNIKRASNIPLKEELEKDIEKIGLNYSAIGRKYGVSDNAVRKWIKKYKLF